MATGMDSNFCLPPPSHEVILPGACFPAGFGPLSLTPISTPYSFFINLNDLMIPCQSQYTSP